MESKVFLITSSFSLRRSAVSSRFGFNFFIKTELKLTLLWPGEMVKSLTLFWCCCLSPACELVLTDRMETLRFKFFLGCRGTSSIFELDSNRMWLLGWRVRGASFLAILSLATGLDSLYVIFMRSML